MISITTSLRQLAQMTEAKPVGFNIGPVYHGTAIPKKSFSREGGGAGVGAHFTDSLKVALSYAEEDASVDGGKPIVMTVRLALHNPFVTDGYDVQLVPEEKRDELESKGYDGMIGVYPDGKEYVVFNPSQVKIVSSKVMR